MTKKKDETETMTAIEVTGDETVASLDADGNFDVGALKASSTFEDLLRAGFETEQFITMDEGDRVLGYMLGQGPNVTIKQVDKKTGVESSRTISTWLFKHPTLNVTMRILGAPVQADGSKQGLDQELFSKPLGALVYVEKGEQEDIGGGRRVNRWKVACNPRKRLPNAADYVKGQLPAHAHVAAAANGAAPEAVIS